jgi:hypothetical protein
VNACITQDSCAPRCTDEAAVPIGGGFRRPTCRSAHRVAIFFPSPPRASHMGRWERTGPPRRRCPSGCPFKVGGGFTKGRLSPSSSHCGGSVTRGRAGCRRNFSSYLTDGATLTCSSDRLPPQAERCVAAERPSCGNRRCVCMWGPSAPMRQPLAVTTLTQ